MVVVLLMLLLAQAGTHRNATDVLRGAHDDVRLAGEYGPIGLVLRVVGVLVGWMVRGV